MASFPFFPDPPRPLQRDCCRVHGGTPDCAGASSAHLRYTLASTLCVIVWVPSPCSLQISGEGTQGWAGSECVRSRPSHGNASHGTVITWQSFQACLACRDHPGASLVHAMRQHRCKQTVQAASPRAAPSPSSARWAVRRAASLSQCRVHSAAVRTTTLPQLILGLPGLHGSVPHQSAGDFQGSVTSLLWGTGAQGPQAELAAVHTCGASCSRAVLRRRLRICGHAEGQLLRTGRLDWDQPSRSGSPAQLPLRGPAPAPRHSMLGLTSPILGPTGPGASAWAGASSSVASMLPLGKGWGPQGQPLLLDSTWVAGELPAAAFAADVCELG